ncbi:hypothetical protein [Pseudomonas syringae]|uniref:Class II aldolase/adducin N-terminal domain-containing protein n=3 Tax=Pseudomonas syringae TaxID=317 RepID=A0A656JJY4_PSESF|nr:hypothetical protein [Pseudomonas syringae]EPN31745.1 hypothetical protein A245_44655 [Pseudomonas syringae pv. actinidiae ICMP 19096]EPM43045.1 hypothetical protein A246_28401 [Pseudomonas syringae pv. actinidiae ICMP 19098]EPM68085.1 hypothetical protein A249_39800 [Pseudomonas syringae pv. actinidiae ICMP 18804]EPN14055.1 hypothetical protein A248_28159 [Pseudomonas syringae pv. actinidiae ICMP 19100]EPN25712.1 hypothetical protein A247_15037 [Pseudomonas syringae pv. actinidiae ICMP 190
MRFQYDRKLTREEVAVHIFLSGASKRASILSRLKETASKYDVKLAVNAMPFQSLALEGVVHSLAIVILDEPYREAHNSLIDKYLGVFDQVSVVFAFSNTAEMLLARPAIEILKALHNDKVNFLRPDRQFKCEQWVSDEKIIENSICDSIRIKFSPRNVGGLVHLTPKEKSFFRRASELYSERHLYHRSASDGYFLMRRDSGFLITATKTYKDKLVLDRITWVHAYDRASNTIFYTGEFLPSSDSVEVAILLAADKRIGAIIHTHASDRWTRNPSFSHLNVIAELPYGEPELGDCIAENVCRQSSDGFLIMREHGEIFWARGELADERLLHLLDIESEQRTYA